MVSTSMSLAARLRTYSRIIIAKYGIGKIYGQQRHGIHGQANEAACALRRWERLSAPRSTCTGDTLEHCGQRRGLATEVSTNGQYNATNTTKKTTTRRKEKIQPQSKSRSRISAATTDSTHGMPLAKAIDEKVLKNETFHFDLGEHTWPPGVIVEDTGDADTTRGGSGEVRALRQALYMAEGTPRRVVDELQASGSDSLLNTKLMRALQKDVFHNTDKYTSSATGARKLLLKGSDGVGKTCCLLTLAAKARHEYGWIVVYVPDVVHSFLSTGMYVKRKGGGGGWDTPEAAAALMRDIEHANTSLAAVRTKTSEGKKLGANLLEAVQAAARLGERNVDADIGPRMDGSAAVDAAAVVFRELMQPEAGEVDGVLIAMDNYDALFGDSEFYESVSLKKRRRIRADELNLVRAWRDIGRRKEEEVRRGSNTERGAMAVGGASTDDRSTTLPKVIFVGATSGRHDYCTPAMASDEEMTTIQPWGVLTTAMYMVRRRLGMQPSYRAAVSSADVSVSSAAGIGNEAPSSTLGEYSVSAREAAQFNSVTGGHPLTTRTSFL